MLKNLLSKTGRNTTLAAIGLALAVIGNAMHSQFDGDPNTTINLKEIGATLVIAWGLLKARDDGNGSAGSPVTP